MGYYDDGEKSYYCYPEYIEPVSLVVEPCTEKDITYALFEAGLIQDTTPRLVCTMEKLVFVHGDFNQVYSPAEIRFTERIEKVLVFPDFFKSMNKGSMACRIIAAKLSCSGNDSIKMCIAFEKIIDKALDGFNLFFFVTEDSVFFGCKIFDKAGKHDCAISSPIKSENTFCQIQEEISLCVDVERFIDFYDQIKQIITSGSDIQDDYESMIVKKHGMRMSYLEELDKLSREMGVDVSREKERYRRQFEEARERAFSDIVGEAEESLAFIKSNKVNAYELLFEAEEMMRQVVGIETENERIMMESVDENTIGEVKNDTEAESLLDDPEEMIKLLKKRRGI